MELKTNNKKMSNTFNGLKNSILYHIKYSLGKNNSRATRQDLFMAMSLAVRERIIDGMFETEERYRMNDPKRLYYLSMEFLMGRSLGNNLYNLGIFDLCKEIVTEMGVDLEEIRESEVDAALGNGGLGRLAACFMDSLATLGYPGYGYGINYEHGLFKQEIYNGYQVEKPDNWLSGKTPWQIERPDQSCTIPVYGEVVETHDRNGNYKPVWMNYQILIGVPHDMPIVGYGGNTVNFLRLYSARSSDDFDMKIFNGGDYLKAVEQKIYSESISKVLYPSDSVKSGKELRLLQEYFFVACSIKDIIRRYLETHKTFSKFSKKIAIQLNDTHPALAVAELMRTFVDDHDMPWERAWEITTATIAYTNHTLLPEALEMWSTGLLKHLLPRHLQIIYEINYRFLHQVASIWPGDHDRLDRMSIIEEGKDKKVRMAYLAIVGSHSVNGVAALHSELVKKELVPDFHELWPDKFNNKTNGVAQRRWLLKTNPLLSSLIIDTIGDEWIRKLDQLKKMEPYAKDKAFQEEFMKIKQKNKERLVKIIEDTVHISVDPNSLFSVQVKRIHEYKRQLLNIMQIIHLYLNLVRDKLELTIPRTFIFAGKAAPGYFMAKLIIKLINSVAHVINNDPRVKGKIKVVFIPDYKVSLAEKIIPAADLSVQISTAGMEASGTGNMKFAMNGGVTIGTLDGATVEIQEEVGSDNIYIFGLRVEDIRQMLHDNSYHPRDYYENNQNIKRVMNCIGSDMFCPFEPDIFKPIYHNILDHGDKYFHLADLEAYINTEEKAALEYTNKTAWAEKAILNVARIGKFSSDRTITEYAENIWNIKPVLKMTQN